ncbi:hypothetical protein [Oceanobacter kriegii]|uniref:hypothetical protein n=1 Tax=Oceanobacter kriegii TaxID=64972 RepID=UPI00042A0485|nr:hypothetical protein [Oceanobacter kriegii]
MSINKKTPAGSLRRAFFLVLINTTLGLHHPLAVFTSTTFRTTHYDSNACL